MSTDYIKKQLIPIAKKYNMNKLCVFGSRACGSSHATSDIDLLAEFPGNVGLILLGTIKEEMEEALGIPVDLIHAPLPDDCILDVGDVIEIYAA